MRPASAFSIGVIFGCNHPMVMWDTECKGLHESGESHFILQGSAYLHGYMYGKAIKELTRGDLTPETFYIT